MTEEQLPLTLVASDGARLEGRLHCPPKGNPLRACIVVTHPHPLYGGDMNNTVPASMAAALPHYGVAVLRFNFRGVGQSSGNHDEGRSERDDVLTAIDYLTERFPGAPMFLVGYSFGADVALDVVDKRIAGWLAIAPPLRVFDTFAAASDSRPKDLLVPAQDQFRPPAAARIATRDWVECSIEELSSCDHYLAGAGGRLTSAAQQLVDRVLMRADADASG